MRKETRRVIASVYKSFYVMVKTTSELGTQRPTIVQDSGLRKGPCPVGVGPLRLVEPGGVSGDGRVRNRRRGNSQKEGTVLPRSRTS